MTHLDLSDQELSRRQSLNRLRELGIEPYPAAEYKVNALSNEILAAYKEDKPVVIAGRIMSFRLQGKAAFVEIQDEGGRIQAYFNRDEICPGDDKTLYNEVFKKLLDLGDFIGIEGKLFKTKVSENGHLTVPVA